MSEWAIQLADLVRQKAAPVSGSSGGDKKNYTEAVSHSLAEIIAAELRSAGLGGVPAPVAGRDKSFMGGYGPKGVDVYLADERHGLLLTSGIKGLVFDPRKNLKNRYRDMVMEALELHRRFPYAVCGHLLFLGRAESMRSSAKFGTVLGEALVLLSGISSRKLPTDAPELYEEMGILLFEPGHPGSVDLAPEGVPDSLRADTYVERLAGAFNRRNPFY